MNEKLIERIESNPKYIELVSKRNSLALKLGFFVLIMFYGYISIVAFDKELFATKIGDGVTTIAIPIAFAILVISFFASLIFVRRATTDIVD